MFEYNMLNTLSINDSFLPIELVSKGFSKLEYGYNYVYSILGSAFYVCQ